MSNAASSNPKRDRPYDLEERTAVFGEAVIGFAKRIPRGDVASPLISQLVRAATSIGANWCEADDAGSKKEFRYRNQCKQTRIERDKALAANGCRRRTRAQGTGPATLAGSKELHLIFAAIHRGKKE